MATIKVLLGVLLIALVCGYKGAEAYDDCPSDWKPFGDFCYWPSRSKVNYEVAKANCEEFDSYMVVPLSKEENTFIHDLIWNLRGKVWLGCDDLENEGEFVCQDSTPNDYDAWQSREPDNNENTIYEAEQDCMGMTYDGGWVDLNCVKTFHYVCKKAK